jgi:hypothetical protein
MQQPKKRRLAVREPGCMPDNRCTIENKAPLWSQRLTAAGAAVRAGSQ